MPPNGEPTEHPGYGQYHSYQSGGGDIVKNDAAAAADGGVPIGVNYHYSDMIEGRLWILNLSLDNLN